MPPRDPRECPALREAPPADDVDNGTWRELGEPREVLFGDPDDPADPDDWREVTAVAWWLNRHGQPVIQLLWSSGGTMWGQAYIADPARIREA
jgi:hypothetical protein